MTDAPAEAEILKWHRRFGVECNNRAWRLSEAASRSSAEDDEMLHAAHAAALHWSKAGTERNAALAEMLLGHVHALLEHGTMAMHYARAAFDYITSREAEPWEVAFAHAVLANAASAANDAATHANHYAIAKQTGSALANVEERRIFEATFARIPIPQPPTR